MEKYIYQPVRFYLITFACTWFWWLFAILLNEGTGLYLGMFLGLVSPAVVAVVTVFTSKNKALINDFKKKLIGFYRIKPIYIYINCSADICCDSDGFNRYISIIWR